MLTVYAFKFFFRHKQTFYSVIHDKDGSANQKTKQNDNFFQISFIFSIVFIHFEPQNYRKSHEKAPDKTEKVSAEVKV